MDAFLFMTLFAIMQTASPDQLVRERMEAYREVGGMFAPLPLSNEDRERYRKANVREVVEKFGEATIPALLSYATDENIFVRADAVHLLSLFPNNDSATRMCLARMSADKNDSIALEALQCVRGAGDVLWEHDLDRVLTAMQQYALSKHDKPCVAIAVIGHHGRGEKAKGLLSEARERVLEGASCHDKKGIEDVLLCVDVELAALGDEDAYGRLVSRVDREADIEKLYSVYVAIASRRRIEGARMLAGHLHDQRRACKLCLPLWTVAAWGVAAFMGLDVPSEPQFGITDETRVKEIEQEWNRKYGGDDGP